MFKIKNKNKSHPKKYIILTIFKTLFLNLLLKSSDTPNLPDVCKWPSGQQIFIAF